MTCDQIAIIPTTIYLSVLRYVADCGMRLDSGTKPELCSLYVLREIIMFRAVIQEAVALTSVALFVGMIAIWSQVIGNL